jgi:hypothetical protein
MTALILPWANTEMMNIFLRPVAENFSDYFSLMRVDQAGWQPAQNLELPENISLIKLPPGSPELNPSEHIGEEIREKNFAHRAFRDLDEVEDTPCQGLYQLAGLASVPAALLAALTLNLELSEPPKSERALFEGVGLFKILAGPLVIATLFI